MHHRPSALSLTICIVFVNALILGCSNDGAPPVLADADRDRANSIKSDAETTTKSPTSDGENEEVLTRYPNDEFTPSFAQLMANPDRYHGKKIRLKGFLRVEFEGTGIYLTKEHADHLISKEAFWVSFDKKALRYEGGVGPKEFDRKWVLIEGTFDKNGRGHFSGWSGAITKIDRVMLLTNYGEIRDKKQVQDTQGK